MCEPRTHSAELPSFVADCACYTIGNSVSGRGAATAGDRSLPCPRVSAFAGKPGVRRDGAQIALDRRQPIVKQESRDHSIEPVRRPL